MMKGLELAYCYAYGTIYTIINSKLFKTLLTSVILAFILLYSLKITGDVINLFKQVNYLNSTYTIAHTQY